MSNENYDVTQNEYGELAPEVQRTIENKEAQEVDQVIYDTKTSIMGKGSAAVTKFVCEVIVTLNQFMCNGKPLSNDQVSALMTTFTHDEWVKQPGAKGQRKDGSAILVASEVVEERVDNLVKEADALDSDKINPIKITCVDEEEFVIKLKKSIQRFQEALMRDCLPVIPKRFKVGGVLYSVEGTKYRHKANDPIQFTKEQLSNWGFDEAIDFEELPDVRPIQTWWPKEAYDKVRELFKDKIKFNAIKETDDDGREYVNVLVNGNVVRKYTMALYEYQEGPTEINLGKSDMDLSNEIDNLFK